MAGVEVVWAANHWESAVRYHALNHPQVRHHCQDLHQANWAEVPPHDVALCSPACQGHSPARGKERPHHDAARSTAWAVVSCAECHRRAVLGRRERPGLHGLGAFPGVGSVRSKRSVTAWHRTSLTLPTTACHSTGSGCSSSWPGRRLPSCSSTRQRHTSPSAGVWSWDRYKWQPVSGHCRNTLNRVEQGRDRFGSRFAMPDDGSGSGETGRCLERPDRDGDHQEPLGACGRATE